MNIGNQIDRVPINVSGSSIKDVRSPGGLGADSGHFLSKNQVNN